VNILPDLTQTNVVPLRPGKGRPKKCDENLILRMYDAGETFDAIAIAAGCSIATARKYVIDAGRPMRGQGSRGRRKGAARAANTRHSAHTATDKPASMPPVNNPAFTEARTVYPSTVISPEDHARCLIPGVNNRKIGGEVLKGDLKGLPIFTLTLEERATCPTTCRHWRSCYGNNMHLSKRFKAGQDLEKWLPIEVAMLMRANPQGILVRLHILGDFYSVEYVEMWKRLLDEYPALHVFGFTARIGDAIGDKLIQMTADYWPRFAMRFSNAPLDYLTTVSIEHPVQKPEKAVICPAQEGKTAGCGSCALCWQSKKQIAFLQH
jgi:hypothetical protein